MQTRRYIIKALCIFLLASCTTRQSEEQGPNTTPGSAADQAIYFTEEQYNTAGIELGSVETRAISGIVQANGSLEVPPQQMVSVSVPIGGFLKSTPLLQGSRVRKGQAVATIENLEFIQIQQDYLEAKSQLEFVKADYLRQQELGKENVNSQKTLQQSKAAFDSWQAKFAGLQEKLKVMKVDLTNLDEGNLSSTIELYTPIDGYVTQIRGNIGTFVAPSDVLFVIVDTEHLHVELTVFEKDVAKLKVGQKVKFTLASENRERTATVYLLGREIAPDRTIRIHCHLAEEDINLLPGMYLRAKIETGGAEVDAVPDDAIVDYLGTKYVFYHEAQPSQSTASEGSHRFTMHEVKAGNSESGYTEVDMLKGPAPPGHVVVSNAYSILAKLRNTANDE